MICVQSPDSTSPFVKGDRSVFTLDARHAVRLGAEGAGTADPLGKDGGVRTGQAPPSIAQEALRTERVTRRASSPRSKPPLSAADSQLFVVAAGLG